MPPLHFEVIDAIKAINNSKDINKIPDLDCKREAISDMLNDLRDAGDIIPKDDCIYAIDHRIKSTTLPLFAKVNEATVTRKVQDQLLPDERILGPLKYLAVEAKGGQVVHVLFDKYYVYFVTTHARVLCVRKNIFHYDLYQVSAKWNSRACLTHAEACRPTKIECNLKLRFDDKKHHQVNMGKVMAQIVEGSPPESQDEDFVDYQADHGDRDPANNAFSECTILSCCYFSLLHLIVTFPFYYISQPTWVGNWYLTTRTTRA